MDIRRIATSIKGLNFYLNRVISDERGSYCDMAPGGTDNPLYADGIKHIHASIATKKFTPRGGHYHFDLKENFFTLNGTALWYFYDFNPKSPAFGESFSVIFGYDKLGIDVGIPEYTIDQNVAAQIVISPGIYHVFWPLTEKETVVVGTGSADYNPKDYNRKKIEDVPGAIETFEKIKKKILEFENRRDLVPVIQTVQELKNINPPSGRGRISVFGQSGKSLQTPKIHNNKPIHKIKALIPAAKNHQQRPFSHTINKHLIPLGGKPMIFYPIESLISCGIDQIGIIINKEDGLLRQIIGNGSRWEIKIEYIIQKELTGLGSAIMSAKDYIKDEPFILYLGDNVIKDDLSGLIDRYFEEKLNALLLLAKVEFPQRFGVPEIKNGKIVRVEERPIYPKSEFAVCGVYIYDNHVFEAMSSIKPSGRGQYEISDIHNYYINNDLNLSYRIIDKWWKDRGKPENLLEGNKFALENFVFENKNEKYVKGEIIGNARIEGNVKIDKGSRILGKTLIRGPVTIEKGCLIKDSYIGPYTSIGNLCELNEVEIESSLVMDNVNINTNKKIVNSIIGKNSSVISKEDNLPKGNRLIIGENSAVGL